MIPNLAEILLGFVVIPWCIFVTVSIFNQRQEVAILKEIVRDLRQLLNEIRHRD